MTVLLVTGTSTGVGKTVVTAALAAAARAHGRTVAVCKPAQTGVGDDCPEESDIDVVERLSGVRGIELARYPEPLAPDVAARRSGRPMLELTAVVDAVLALDETHDLVLVEGAGGVAVRLGAAGFTALDIAAAVGASVLIVAGAELGTLNHSALTVAAVHAAGVTCSGLVIGSWSTEPSLAARVNLEELPLVTGVELIASVPGGAGLLDEKEFGALARTMFGEFTDSLLG
ncbi:dethiobiotin synthase [Rhodococcus sp. 14-2483-1-1]|uniref:dethiobiotin synthase n=1 Tax=unclassified Rhodococcus (in: high G+C Gram-positive bacteria) TaxID=192944 RepID=UPI000B9A9B91|nr:MULTISPECIES: dethiobiotin synthase [unclassified Rhodococcus (in: high G+C Gram-positive bacteria)]OZE79679.1 dethiobiotin synthase [Rhodococcus sp. 15-649-2-2]OZF35864.1 dethiobiotin synthase [Rhodococcus sp. 14-2483-1-1]